MSSEFHMGLRPTHGGESAFYLGSLIPNAGESVSDAETVFGANSRGERLCDKRPELNRVRGAFV
jgi:hypothetical protein